MPRTYAIPVCEIHFEDLPIRSLNVPTDFSALIKEQELEFSLPIIY